MARGAGRHEDDVHALLADHARKLRELDVVADQNGDAAKGRVKHTQVVACVTVPFLLLPAGQVDLLLGEMLAFGREQISRIEQLAVGDGGVAAADDVHPPLARQIAEQSQIALGVIVHVAHGAAQIAGVHEGQQLRGENLREHDELGLVVASRLHDETHLVFKRIPAVDGAQQVLHSSNAHRALARLEGDFVNVGVGGGHALSCSIVLACPPCSAVRRVGS